MILVSVDNIISETLNGGPGVPWFPQEWSRLFFVIKGILGLIATLMLLFHMSISWGNIIRVGTLGQELRYLTLLGLSVLITGASAEQIHQHHPVDYRSLGAFILAASLIVAMGVSLKEDYTRTHKKKSSSWRDRLM